MFVLFHFVQRVVDSRATDRFGFCRRQVAGKVGHFRFGIQLDQLQHRVAVECDVFDPLFYASSLYHFHNLGGQRFAFPFVYFLGFQLDDQFGLFTLLEFIEVGGESGHRFTVGKHRLPQDGRRGSLDLPHRAVYIDVRIVENHQFPVRAEVNVAFRTVSADFVRFFEGSERILGRSACIPISAVDDNLCGWCCAAGLDRIVL